MANPRVNLNAVHDYLTGVSYPCDKQDLIEFAEDHDAPEDILGALEQIPEREYQSAGDVARGLGNIH